MAGAGPPDTSARTERAESSRLAWAFVISIAFHLLIFGTYQTGKKAGWWQNIHWPVWFPAHKSIAEILKKNEHVPLEPSPPQEPPLMFVDVSPAQAVPEPPKDAKYYSDKNSLAANPDATVDTGTPKIDGQQNQVVKTEDVPREKYVPMQPAQPTPPPPPPKETAPEPKPVPPQEIAKTPPKEIPVPEPIRPAQLPPGEMNVGKPQPDKTPPDKSTSESTVPKPEPAPAIEVAKAERTRPRTIQEALARLGNNRPPGLKMKQEGGVQRHLDIVSLDAKVTPFGAYDAAFIEAVRDHWFNLLDQRGYGADRQGKVVLNFNLHYDGRITDMNVVENTTSEVLGVVCRKAIEDPAPFAAWPSDMRRVVGNVRYIQFTFYYN